MKQLTIIAISIIAFLSGAFVTHVVAQDRLMRINTNVGTYVNQTQGQGFDRQVALNAMMNLIAENIKLKKAAGITE